MTSAWFVFMVLDAGVTFDEVPIGNKIFISGLAAILLWIFLKLTVLPAVVLDHKKRVILVKNILQRVEIPFSSVKSVEVPGGLYIRTYSGRTYDSAAFSGSLFGALTGNKQNLGCAQTLKECIGQDLVVDEKKGSVSEKIYIQFYIPIGVFCFYYTLFWVA
ncbi:hypothetical protein [Nocardiopsis chromatogenes]|uniref:hypothetical protein n=1 Tax=Nocardiopsis chromatogenes TaxID=280239 RepID=UPI001267E04F|nr:hypothetical protein [Nocardiopsis chromatogenes]